MMNFKQLVNKCFEDPEDPKNFYKRLQENPAAALKDEPIDPKKKAELIEALEKFKYGPIDHIVVIMDGRLT